MGGEWLSTKSVRVLVEALVEEKSYSEGREILTVGISGVRLWSDGHIMIDLSIYPPM